MNRRLNCEVTYLPQTAYVVLAGLAILLCGCTTSQTTPKAAAIPPAISTIRVVALDVQPTSFSPDTSRDLSCRLQSEKNDFRVPIDVELWLQFEFSSPEITGQVIQELFEAGKLEISLPSGQTVTRPIVPYPTLRGLSFLRLKGTEKSGFSYRVEIGKNVDLSSPGKYSVVWSSGKLRTNTVILEIR